ncbi:MAG: YCF48-related protein [Candidatus Zhuqueibacterota bacterium]
MWRTKFLIPSVIFALFNFFQAINLYAQGSWKIIRQDTLTIYTDMDFVDKNNGWVIGYSLATVGVEAADVIIHTSDGGETWEYQKFRTGGRLFALNFMDSLHGWALAYNGVILHTKDGGKKWDPDSSLYQQWWKPWWRATDIYFVDTLKGWVIGNNPQEIYHTQNGGKTWIHQYTGGSEDGFSTVFFLDSLVGWVSDRGKILHTEDSGRNWIKQYVATDSLYFGSIYFINSQLGWIVGVGLPRNIILKTSDGGQSWEVTPIGWGFELGGICFVDSLHGWIAGGPVGGCVLYTNDGGKTWTSQDTGMGEGLLLRSVCFIDSCTGWAMGPVICSDITKVLKYTCSSSSIDNNTLNNPICPGTFKLLQSYPNPFNLETTIRFYNPQAARISVAIYDIGGRLVKSLISNEMLSIGYHEVRWSGRDQQGNVVPSGVYLCTLKSKENVKAIKLVAIK